MNLKLCFIATLMTSVVLVCAQNKNKMTFMDIFKMTLMDPEYLALNNSQQIKVLNTIYSILENNIKNRVHKQQTNHNEGRWRRSLSITHESK